MNNMAQEKKIPLVYEIIFEKLKERAANSSRMNGKLTMQEIHKVLGVVFHIPKEFHYNLIRELEEYDLIVMSKGGFDMAKALAKKSK